MKYVINETEVPGEFSWWLATDTDVTAWAGRSFPTLKDAHRAAAAFALEAAEEKFAIYEDDNHQWRWRATRSTKPEAQSAESYAARFDAEQAAEAVRLGAASATMP